VKPDVNRQAKTRRIDPRRAPVCLFRFAGGDRYGFSPEKSSSAEGAQFPREACTESADGLFSGKVADSSSIDQRHAAASPP
jgi:hypothetical protein